AKVQFANKGSIRRTILGVTFTCRSKDENGENLLMKSKSPYTGYYEANSLYVEPDNPEVQSYTFTLESEFDLTKKPGSVFGLQVVRLNPDSSQNFVTVEAMVVIEYKVGEQRGIAFSSSPKSNISLDVGSYNKMEEPVMQIGEQSSPQESRHDH